MRIRYSWWLTGALVGAFIETHAQGVGIGTTTPNSSAALDIVSSSKGVLLPRVADATAIASPAPGLLVYQTGGAAGFYYNAGTAAAPSWQQLATAASATVAVTNGLTRTGNTIGLGGTLTQATTLANAGNNLAITGTGRVGIGTTAPAHPLTVQADGGNRLLGFSDGSGTDKYNFSRVAPTGSGAAAVPGGLNLSESNVAGGRLYVQDGGQVGIGTTAPAAQLDVEGGGLLVGNGGSVATQGAHLQWNHSGGEGETYLINNLGLGNATTAGIRFGGAATSGTPATTTLTEWARFQSNGYLGLGTTSPGARLDVAGQVRITGGSPGAGKVLTSDATGLATWEPVVGATTANSIQNQTATTQPASFRIGGSGRIDGENQGLIVDAAGNARVGLMKYAGRETGLWRTSSESLEIGRVGVSDLTTAPTGSTLFTTDLYVDGTGNVGIGTGTTAAARLHVAGTAGTSNVRLESLGGTGTRLVTTDASGNLSSQAAPGGTDFILNQTAQQASSNFNVSGAGTVGGLLTATGGATITGPTSINTSGGAATTIGGFSGALGLSGSTLSTYSAGNATQYSGGTLTTTSAGAIQVNALSNLSVLALGGLNVQGGSLTATTTGMMTLNGISGFAANTTGAMNLSSITSFRASTAASVLDITNAGMVLRSDPGMPITLNAGTPSNVGVGIAAPTSSLHVAGSVAMSLNTATSNFTLSLFAHTVRCNPGCTQLTLPDATTCAGREYVLINSKANTAAVALVLSGSQSVIDDTTAPVVTSLPIGSRYTIQSDGSNWIVTGR